MTKPERFISLFCLAAGLLMIIFDDAGDTRSAWFLIGLGFGSGVHNGN